jgi:DNA-directed RNA polymerase omega subunit
MKAALSENKYHRVLIAAQRARQLEKGARPLVKVDNMKTTNIALREVELGLIGFDFIRDPKDVTAHRI